MSTTHATAYQVRHSHGITETYDTYEEAVEAVRRVYTDPVIGHPGDLEDTGSRTLVWTTEELAWNDDGSRACCAIVPLIDAEERAFAFEAKDEDGQWTREAAGSLDAPTFSSWEAAESELPNLASCLGCPLGDVRVVEVRS